MGKWLDNFGQHLSNIWNDPSMLLNPVNYVNWIAPDIFGYAEAPQNEKHILDLDKIDMGSLGNSSFLQGLGNTITGNVDFLRQYALQEYNNSFNAQQAQETRQFNAEENQKQRDWYERMSNSSFQRQVKDMQNAGLNPYISMSTGSPVAYGSSASSTSPTATGIGSQHSGQGIQAFASIINTALSLGAKSSEENNNSLTYLMTKLISKLA